MSRPTQPQRDYAKAHRVRHKKWLAHYKSSWGCVDCGWNEHPIGLEFDHAHGKKERSFAQTHSAKKIIDELLKCDVVCAICHNVRTYERDRSDT